MPQLTVLMLTHDGDDTTEVSIDSGNKVLIDKRIEQHVIYDDKVVVGIFNSDYVLGIYPTVDQDGEENNFKLEINDGQASRSY